MNGTQVKRLRLALGLTQEKLSELIGCQRHTIARWELNYNTPRGANLKALVELAATAKRKNKGS